MVFDMVVRHFPAVNFKKTSSKITVKKAKVVQILIIQAFTYFQMFLRRGLFTKKL